MSILKIKHPTKKIHAAVDLPASKSISNRLLILQQLLHQRFSIQQLSDADDTRIMQHALSQTQGTVDVKNAGTCMRFLTAYYACLPGSDVILHGNERMHSRSIDTLVEALKSLGADIDYIHHEGYPPLRVKGKQLKGGVIEMGSNISSQFVSAMMLVAPWFTNGLVITLHPSQVSMPYIQMTARAMQWCGLDVHIEQDIVIKPYSGIVQPPSSLTVEADWSAAAFWYVHTALSQSAQIQLNQLMLNSAQGDSVVANYMARFGVNSDQITSGIELQKDNAMIEKACYNMSDYPDLVPPLAVLMCALNIPCTFTHVQHLEAKETKRLTALCNELNACGFYVRHDENELTIHPVESINPKLHPVFKTYGDHRMAMSLSALALVFDEIRIEQPEVVEKSYPNYWQQMQKAGFILEQIQ
ncbi:MAG: 3-phosphoshikimate 1-carboxyvinyltransferase [Bacteroidota bacterium]